VGYDDSSLHASPLMTPSAATEQLRRELRRLDATLLARLHARGFHEEHLLRLAAPLLQGGADDPDASKARRDARNRVQGIVTPPTPEELPSLPEPGSEEHGRLSAVGRTAIENGELAFCVLAGGMATRMGSVVKALVEVVPGHTFLDLRLRENALWSERIGRPLPLWLMTSDATDLAIEDALAEAAAGSHIGTFLQNLSVRITPDGHIFRTKDGKASTYGPGHGDLVDSIRRAGVLREFRAQGGRYVWIANLDNLGATIDPAILGAFIESRARVMVEVVDKAEGDRGGIPVHAEGRLQVLEEFRLPVGFDASIVRVFNTNTFLVDAEALELAPINWHWFEVNKTVEERTAVQFERLLQELTAALPSRYLRVPREGAASRFMPVKDREELERRRAAIELVARSRGIL
jgi:UTP--glucose-1-phosphate uridylyltransferase